LVSWLETSDYDRVTLIPFASSPKERVSFVLPRDIPLVRDALDRLHAGGGTNLAEALGLALDLGSTPEEGLFVRYLIITDGLSDDPVADLRVLERLPKDQGIDVLFINPTPEAELHVKNYGFAGITLPCIQVAVSARL
jgi:Mg-chelatase subunit ChlD